MSSRTSVVILVAAVVVTVICLVLYIVEPAPPGHASGIASGSLDAVPVAHRIAAIDRTGAVEVLDNRNGSVADKLRVRVDPGDGARVALESKGRGAYVSGAPSGNTTGEIRYVHLDDGSTSHVADGQLLALSPDDRQLAYVRVVDGRTHLIMQNATTGDESDLGAAGAPALAQVRDLAWTADGQDLAVLTSSPSQPLWRIRHDAHAFDEAQLVAMPSMNPGASIDAISHTTDGVALAVRDTSGAGAGATGGTSKIMSVDLTSGRVTPVGMVAGTATALDTGANDTALLVVLRDGSLDRWDRLGPAQRVTGDVIAAS